MADELTERQQQMLDLEKLHWKFAGAKEGRIRDLFDVSSTVYYQQLDALIDTPEAEAAEPTLVRRLHRLREARQTQRSARARGVELD